MRCLVTGGAGFLGSHLCERLLGLGHEVIAIDNLFTGKEENIEHLKRRSSFRFERHDVVVPTDLKVERIFNLACPASPQHYQRDPVKTVRTSVMGVLNMLDLAKVMKARILQASTSEVYGDPQEHPQREEYWGNVNPIGVRACYDEGKRVAETLMMDFHRQYHVDTRMIRIFNTYGPRMAEGDGRVVSNFIVQALRGEKLTVYGDGSQTRCFCYVDDMIDAIIALMNYEGRDAAEPVNVGSEEELKISEIVAALAEVLGRELPVEKRPLPEDDPARRKPDCARARKRLGWQPRVSLREGLRRTVDYFRSKLPQEQAV
jgi:UDP-glucuronate decarboxylase